MKFQVSKVALVLAGVLVGFSAHATPERNAKVLADPEITGFFQGSLAKYKNCTALTADAITWGKSNPDNDTFKACKESEANCEFRVSYTCTPSQGKGLVYELEGVEQSTGLLINGIMFAGNPE